VPSKAGFKKHTYNLKIGGMQINKNQILIFGGIVNE
jgi:hypothetical protein